MSQTYRILSLDGGGVRGVVPAAILAAIEQRTGKPISKLFDLVAGTSTGGILALGLLKPDSNGNPEFSAKRLCELYDEHIPQIFGNPQSWWGNLLGPKYKSFAFQEVLQQSLGNCRLKDALVDVIIPCYDIEHRMPFMFKSRLAKLDIEEDFPMRDVALAASASPTLFHPVRIPRKSSYGRFICLVDGGVFANNPAVCGYSELKSVAQNEEDDYFVVSIGTGKSTRPLSDEIVSLWGYVQWSRPMLELVMESNSESVHQQIRHLFPTAENNRQYYRLQVELPTHTNFAIDDASSSNLKLLRAAAQEFCARSKELDAVCERLLGKS